MQYDVWITVRGDQEYEDMGCDHTELTVAGILEKSENGWTIFYDEAEQSGPESTRTLFLIDEQCVVLRRRGLLRSEMIFEAGKTHTTVYEMPFGSLPMEISTESIRQKLSERGGVLEIRYRLNVGQQVRSRNRFRVQVKRKV